MQKQAIAQVENGYVTTVFGARFRMSFSNVMLKHQIRYRPFDGVDHFEWQAVLESIRSAGDSYVMIDLGAGFGWWGVNAAAAFRQEHANKPGRVILIEAEPQHYAFLETAVAENRFPGIRYDTFRAAVGPARGRDWFYISESLDWYGQRLMLDYHREHLQSGRGEHVHRSGANLETSDGYRLCEVDVLPLHEILERCGHVDLIDMDIQGTELDLIRSTPRALLLKCRRLFISTHSAEIHRELQERLEADWELAVSHLPGTTAPTADGSIELLDGVQHWKRR